MTLRAKRRMRLAAAAAACLLLGATASIAVAWACVLWGPDPRPRLVQDPALRWPSRAPPSWPAVPDAAHKSATWAVSAARASRSPGLGFWAIERTASGVPLRCAASDTFLSRDARAPISMSSSGIEVPAFLGRRIPIQDLWRSHLPTTILWPGFLADTLLYAGLFSVPVFGPGFLRRARRRRGLCPACGYSRAGLDPAAACPECGGAAAGLHPRGPGGAGAEAGARPCKAGGEQRA